MSDYSVSVDPELLARAAGVIAYLCDQVEEHNAEYSWVTDPAEIAEARRVAAALQSEGARTE